MQLALQTTNKAIYIPTDRKFEVMNDSLLLSVIPESLTSEKQLRKNHVKNHLFPMDNPDVSRTEDSFIIKDGRKEIIIPNNNTDIYIYGMSASNEYVNRVIEASNKETGKVLKTKVDSAIKTISAIVTKIGKSNIEISVALLKNISDYENALKKDNNKRQNLQLETILSEIKLLDKAIDEKITKSITEILGAIS